MPTPGSVDALSRLAAKGHPIEYKVYPKTEHGLVEFKNLSARDRQATSFHPEYFDDMIAWLNKMANKSATASST